MTEQNTAENERELLFAEARGLGVQFSNNIGTDTLRARVNDAKAKKANEQAAEDAGHVEHEDDLEVVNTAPTEQLDPTTFVNSQLSPEKTETEVNSNPYTENAPNVDITPLIPTAAATGAATKAAKHVPAHVDIDLSHITDPNQYRSALIKRERRLVRCRISNLNPKKADLEGEFFTVSNEFIGNVKMFVPYGEKTEDGWHIPYCIYKQLKAREFQNIRSYTDKVTKQIRVDTSMRAEFAIEVLEPLTQEELDALRVSAAGQ